MSRRLIGLLLAALVVIAMSACDERDDPTGEQVVGDLAVHWDQASNNQGSELLPGLRLLSEPEIWQEWLDQLPTRMYRTHASAIREVSLDEHVIVVAVWDRCHETSTILHDGEGRLRFETAAPDRVECELLPRQVEVWQIALNDLGVHRDQVSLADATSGIPQTPSVGQRVVHWDEFVDDGVSVSPLRMTQADVELVIDDAAWQAWAEEVPEQMRETHQQELAAVSTDDHVLVVAVWDRCTDISMILHDGDGNLRFVAQQLNRDEVCEAMFTQVEVWRVALSDLGVDRDRVRAS